MEHENLDFLCKINYWPVLHYQEQLWTWLSDQAKILREVSWHVGITWVKIPGQLEFRKAIQNYRWPKITCGQ